MQNRSNETGITGSKSQHGNDGIRITQSEQENGKNDIEARGLKQQDRNGKNQ